MRYDYRPKENARSASRCWLAVWIFWPAVVGSVTPGFSQTEYPGDAYPANAFPTNTYPADVYPPDTCRLPPTLPAVPLREPRPAEGPDAHGQWKTGREGAETSPVASFVEALQGNDVVVEVVVGQGRLMTMKSDIASRDGTAVIAVGDPTVVGFEVLPNPRVLRLVGKRAGVTDMSIITSDGQTYGFEIHVLYDLTLLRARLMQVFPDAHLRLGQIREHVVVEGQARSPAQVSHILQTIAAYLESVQVPHAIGAAGPSDGSGADGRPSRHEHSHSPSPGVAQEGSSGDAARDSDAAGSQDEGRLVGRQGAETGTGAAYVAPKIINLIRVPGVHQVLLQVKVAELNRTGLREIGADILGVDPDTGNIFGTQIGGATINALGTLGLGGLVGLATGEISPNTTAFGIFPSGDWQILLRALRQNSLLKILAEPNLMAMSGHEASFLAGGQFPVPVPQTGGGISNNVTIEFKDFGVQLDFTPYVLDDERIRLNVTPEVSTIDFSLGTTLVVGGDPVPGVNTRRATTTVELRQGQTLAIAGLLQVVIDAQTSRIPGLGDLPYLGPLFSNTTHRRVEKELLVLVTPYLVEPMDPDQVPCLPGDEIKDPNDLEFYLLNRIEGRTGRDFRSTTSWDDPCCCVELMKLEQRCVQGPVGFSE